MGWWHGWRHVLRATLRRRLVEREQREEAAAFRALQAESAAGPAARSRRATIATTSAADATVPLAAGNGWRLESLALDARYALRALCRAPAFSLTALATLAVAITAAASAITLLAAMFLRPLPFPNDGELVVLQQTDAARPMGFNVSLPNFRDWSARSRMVPQMAAWHELTAAITATGVEPRSGTITTVTGTFFDVFRVPAALGRTVQPVDEATSARVVVLGDRFWREMFSADPGVLGRTVSIDGAAATIVGVMPRDFRYPASADLWTSWPRSIQDYLPRNTITERVVGRLSRGAGVAQAQADVNAIAAALHIEHPNTALNQATGARVISLRDDLLGSETVVFVLLGGAVLFALTVAVLNLGCANLARADSRRAEFAMRAALGAGRTRLVQYWLVESAILTIAAAVAALVIEPWVLAFLWRRAEFSPYQTLQPRVDGIAIGVCALLAVVVATLLGLLPAWRLISNRRDVLAPAGARATSRNSGRAVLITIEVAVATMLLVAAGIAVRGAFAVLSQPRGFDAAPVLTADLRLPFAAAKRHGAIVDDIRHQVEQLPGVTTVGAINLLPLGADPGRSPRIASAVRARGTRGTVADGTVGGGYHAVDGDYFTAMGMTLVRGRSFDTTDTPASARVAVVSSGMAARFWPDEDAIGGQFEVFGADQALAGKQIIVIGVVADVRATSLERATEPDYYVSFAQGISVGWRRYLVVRGERDPALLARGVGDVIRKVASDVPIDLMTMTERVRRSAARRLFAGTALGALAAAGLALVLIGVYGVLSVVVTSRAREIGVRLALGASPRRVRREVARAAITPCLAGLAVGLSAAAMLGRVMTSLTFDSSPRDPWVFASAAAAIAGVALAAAIVPAARAARIDPAGALRS